MKRKRCIIGLLLLCFMYLQLCRAPYINVSTIKNHSGNYDLELIITANKIFITNKEQYAKTLIEKILENDFKNMQFPYDELGYPKEIRIKVYTNNISRFHNVPAFEIYYTTSLAEIKMM